MQDQKVRVPGGRQCEAMGESPGYNSGTAHTEGQREQYDETKRSESPESHKYHEDLFCKKTGLKSDTMS